MTLPSPEDHGLPADAAIVARVPEEGLTVYRLLEHETPRGDDFEPYLTRNQARLKQLPEVFRTSVSHWLTLDQAVAHSQRRPAFVAELRLPSDSLIRVALTQQYDDGHIDVWSHPQDLVAAVERVVTSRGSA
jgi:hypothetical protein